MTKSLDSTRKRIRLRISEPVLIEAEKLQVDLNAAAEIPAAASQCGSNDVSIEEGVRATILKG